MTKPVTISAVGDICLGGFLLNEIASPEKIISPRIKNYLSSDIVFGNLESPFSENGEKDLTPFGFLFAEPKQVDILNYAGFNVVSLANNHICDCGYDGMRYTMKLLSENGINYVGVGENLTEARKPYVVEINGRSRVAIHAYLEQNFEGLEVQKIITATDSHPGAAPLLEEMVEEDIKKSKEQYDLIVVSIHWSVTNNQFVSVERIRFCKKLMDWKADLVLGHHPHVLQGFAQMKNGLVFYSLGNFFFPSHYYTREDKGLFERWNNDQRTSAILKASFADRKSQYEVIPVVQKLKENSDILEIPSTDYQKIIKKLEYLSKIYQKRHYRVIYFFSLIFVYFNYLKSVKKSFRRLITHPFRIVKRFLNQV